MVQQATRTEQRFSAYSLVAVQLLFCNTHSACMPTTYSQKAMRNYVRERQQPKSDAAQRLPPRPRPRPPRPPPPLLRCAAGREGRLELLAISSAAISGKRLATHLR